MKKIEKGTIVRLRRWKEHYGFEFIHEGSDIKNMVGKTATVEEGAGDTWIILTSTEVPRPHFKWPRYAINIINKASSEPQKKEPGHIILPRVHGMAVEQSNSFQCRCPSCPYKEPVSGLIDAFRCTQKVLEGPLYKTDGCNLLERISAGNKNKPLLVTTESVIWGFKEEIVKPVEEPTSPKKEGTGLEIGNMVLLGKHRRMFANDPTSDHWNSNMDQYVNRVATVVEIFANRPGIRLDAIKVEEFPWRWRVENLVLVWPTPLKSYEALKRERKEGEEVLWLRQPGGVPIRENGLYAGTKGITKKGEQIYCLRDEKVWHASDSAVAPLDQ